MIRFRVRELGEKFSQDNDQAQDAYQFLRIFLPGWLLDPGRLLGTLEYSSQKQQHISNQQT